MVEKCKVAIIAGQLVVGGAEQQLYLWLANLDRTRYAPFVLTLHPGHNDYWEKPIIDLDIPLYSIKARQNRIVRLISILGILQPLHPKLIHGWHTFASAYAGVSAKLLQTKSLGGIRSSFQSIENSWEMKITQKYCDALVSNAENTVTAYRSIQQKKKQLVFTVQNAVDCDFESRELIRQNINKLYGVPMDAVLITSIGRMDALKRFDLLIHLAKKLKSSRLDYHCILIGDGPEKFALERLVEDLEIGDKVTFTGEVPFASQWLKGFDIFCFPSMDEGMPNVIMEAAAAGLPIITWRFPFTEELLKDGESAILIPPGDLDSMKVAMLNLIKSPETRERLGSAARYHILKNFSLDRYIHAMSAVYESVING